MIGIRRSWRIHMPYVLPAVDPEVLLRHRLLYCGIVSDWVGAEIFATILIFQMKILDLIFFEKVFALKTFLNLIYFLGLSALNVMRCKFQIYR